MGFAILDFLPARRPVAAATSATECGKAHQGSPLFLSDEQELIAVELQSLTGARGHGGNCCRVIRRRRKREPAKSCGRQRFLEKLDTRSDRVILTDQVQPHS